MIVAVAAAQILNKPDPPPHRPVPVRLIPSKNQYYQTHRQMSHQRQSKHSCLSRLLGSRQTVQQTTVGKVGVKAIEVVVGQAAVVKSLPAPPSILINVARILCQTQKSWRERAPRAHLHHPKVFLLK